MRNRQHLRVTRETLSMRALRTAGLPYSAIAGQYQMSAPAVLQRLACSGLSEFCTAYYPTCTMLAGNTLIAVADPCEYHLHAIQLRNVVSRAEATRWIYDAVRSMRIQGFTPLLLWSDELNSNAVAHMLRYRLRLAGDSVPARACEVVPVANGTAQAFYTRYHLQGGCNGTYHVGLQRSCGRLVACMSFNSGAACRGSADATLLQRFATATNVPGAASRLLTHFLRAERPREVVSYSDNRYSQGQLYRLLGFTLETEGKPDYRYWREGGWFAKSAKKRADLLRELRTPDTGQTEYELARLAGYLRVYDAGKLTWVLKDSAHAP